MGYQGDGVSAEATGGEGGDACADDESFASVDGIGGCQEEDQRQRLRLTQTHPQLQPYPQWPHLRHLLLPLDSLEATGLALRQRHHRKLSP